MFHKILIANRGEIALRVIRTCREMGIQTVIAHSTADTDSLPVRLADESICIGPPESRGSYLNIPSIISAASITDSEAIHPGYGLLSENAAFAEICRACGITFIGPSPEAIRLMGDKAQAREMAKAAGAPVVPGSEGPLPGVDDAQELADRVGYPVMLKSAAGGGGRGMRIVRARDEMPRAFATCQAEAQKAFSSSELYLEKFVDEARHVEVQVMGDKNGMGVPLVRSKLLAFACGASFAGTVGVLFSAKQVFINPESFTFMESIGVLAMVILGGMGSIPGAILGATVVTVLNLQVLKGLSLWLNELRNAGTTIFGWSLVNLPTQLEPAKYERMVFGLILVLMMIFRPQGILPARRRHRELTGGTGEPH